MWCLKQGHWRSCGCGLLPKCPSISTCFVYASTTSMISEDSPMNLPISVFRDNFDLFGPVIVDLINKSLSQGIFPAELKMAKIVPIHKSGEKCRIENYRPISLLPVFSKILEKVVAFQMENYLTSNNLISRNQYGFRPKLSTEMAMHALTDYIYIPRSTNLNMRSEYF